MSDDEERDVCPTHGCELKDFISATEEGTEYFTYCQKCEDGFADWIAQQCESTEQLNSHSILKGGDEKP